jgi:hypothetical protein
MAVVLLHPYRRSQSDTVTALEDLLAEARAGRLIGFAYVAMHHHQDYKVGMAGETKSSPTFTRGMLHLLDDELAALIRLTE